MPEHEALIQSVMGYLFGTLAIGFAIIAAFNGYVAVAQDQPFNKRFAEMAGILIVVSGISFAIGIALRFWFGVDF